MRALFYKLENILKRYSAALTRLAFLLLVVVIVLILIDLVMHVAAELSPRTVKGFGKSAGGAAANLGVLAAMYYAVRGTLIANAKKQITIPGWAVYWLKAVVPSLRLIHPFAGITAGAFALLHGYLLWFPAISKGSAEVSGLILLAASLSTGALGLGILRYRAYVPLRKYHQAAGISLALFFGAHLILLK